MKKTILASLSAAVVGGLGFVGTASAEVFSGAGAGWTAAGGMTATNASSLRINEVERIGHQLIIPYYTVQNNQSTAFNIINTDRENGKAVKVRLRGAVNSDDVLDFQLFLSPGDVWGAWLEQHSDGRMRIATVDNSCTLPRFSKVPASNRQDKEDGETGYLVASTDRVGPGGVIATREGYIEIINMADIAPPRANNASPAFTATKHDPAGVPSCVGLNDIAARTSLINQPGAALQGFNTPSTGLTADWYILNLTQTTAFSGAATAIEAVDDTGVPGRGNFIMFAQSNTRISTASEVSNYTADPLLRHIDVGVDKNPEGTLMQPTLALSLPIVAAQHYDLPDMSTPYLKMASVTPGMADPRLHAARLSALLHRKSVSNQYVITGTDFDTDWVFSLPSRRYSVALNYNATLNVPQLYRVFTAGILYDPATGDGVAGPVGVPGGQGAFFHRDNAVLNTSIDPELPRICVDTQDVTYWNREERSSGNFVVESPGQPGTLSFCGETTVMRMGARAVLGSVISTQTVNPPPATGVGANAVPAFTEGWAWIGVERSSNDVDVGIPVLGYAAIRARNTSVNPVTNYGYTWPHRYDLAE